MKQKAKISEEQNVDESGPSKKKQKAKIPNKQNVDEEEQKVDESGPSKKMRKAKRKKGKSEQMVDKHEEEENEEPELTNSGLYSSESSDIDHRFSFWSSEDSQDEPIRKTTSAAAVARPPVVRDVKVTHANTAEYDILTGLATHCNEDTQEITDDFHQGDGDKVIAHFPSGVFLEVSGLLWSSLQSSGKHKISAKKRALGKDHPADALVSKAREELKAREAPNGDTIVAKPSKQQGGTWVIQFFRNKALLGQITSKTCGPDAMIETANKLTKTITKRDITEKEGFIKARDEIVAKVDATGQHP